MAERSLVLYDGGCPFCRACAKWAETRDAHGRFEFLPFQEAPAGIMTPDLLMAGEQAVHVIAPEGTTYRGGRAVVEVLEGLGWRVGWLRRRPLSWAVEAGYRVVARSRGLLSRFVYD